ncbi:hypothetical protein M9H77_10016 [Catharanthus roseus]|uniref:Uncharacterized protein n=1 Tax=Catharanthus roseus TaxID=4058 RepID=A0ACC0C293_CATRO|nr:hypothetical protein M9H77_10016 [Catharanthus roseus]
MQSVVKKKATTSSDGNSGQQVPKQKERHIVSWSQEEDDILREQIRIHGTENWAIIASKFKDKTTRQCRRRWFTYLNSDFKKGGWSPEEDMLLCEAQKVFGNRWTEIAKVVSGRTDNAVKNRFTTLCKKRAKHEALAKENKNASFINLNNKRVIFPIGLNTDGTSEAAGPLKKRRSHIPDPSENGNHDEKLLGESGTATQSLRHPFAVLAQNSHRTGSNLSTQQNVNDIKETPVDAGCNSKIQGTFLKKDDPKILALMQQAELLSSLAAKVNSENTDQSLESAWKVLQDFLNQPKESDEVSFRISEMSFQLENIKDLIEDLQGSNDCSRQSWRQPDLYEESSASSDYSTGSTLPSNAQSDKTEQIQSDISGQYPGIEPDLQPPHAGHLHGLAEGEQEMSCDQTADQDILPSCEEITTESLAACGFSNADYSSPLHETPLFRTIAATIPSPKFSESEKHFLLRALGMEPTPSDSSITNPSQPPTCKRALLQSL